MNRFDLASAAGLFVLVLGLASCSQETKTSSDTYRVPQPVVVTTKGQKDLVLWARETEKTLDLQDAFDVSAGNPFRTEITANCTSSKTSYSGQFKVNGRQPIHIFQVVPQELLVEDLSKNPFSCSWELSLYNEIGSRHVLQLPISPIRDQERGEVSLEGASNNEKISFIQLSQARAYKVRYRNAETSTAEIFCADVNLDPLPFDKVLDLNQFNFHKPTYRPGKNEDTLDQFPEQRCRIAVKEGGQIRQISSQVTLYFAQSSFELIASSIPAPVKAEFDFFRHRGGEMADVTIRNPTKGVRLLQIPRVLAATLDAVLIANYGSTAAISVRALGNGPWVSVQIASAPTALKEEAAGWTFALGPKQSLSLRLRFHAPNNMCPYVLTAFKVAASPLTITELAEGRVKLSDVSLKIPEYSWKFEPRYLQLSESNQRCF